MFDYAALHSDFQAHRIAGRIDAAYCVAAALACLHQATRDEYAFVDHYKPRQFTPAPRPLTEHVLRRHVFPPELDPFATAIFGLIAPAVARWRSVDLPGTLTQPVDPRNHGHPMARKVNLVSSQLLIVPPELYLRPTDPGWVVVLNVHRGGVLRPSAVVFGDLLHGKTDAQVSFALGRALIAFYLPFYCYVALDRSPEHLVMVLDACLRAAGIPVRGDLAALDAIGREITGRLSPPEHDQLRHLARRFAESGGSFDIRRWVNAADFTASRVGFILCCDINVAVQMVPRDKAIDLIRYSTTEGYFAAREAIGVQLA